MRKAILILAVLFVLPFSSKAGDDYATVDSRAIGYRLHHDTTIEFTEAMFIDEKPGVFKRLKNDKVLCVSEIITIEWYHILFISYPGTDKLPFHIELIDSTVTYRTHKTFRREGGE